MDIFGGSEVAHTRQAPDQRPVVTAWKSDAANQTVTIPLAGSGMTIHWSDGYSTGVAGTATHVYVNASTYVVLVYGGLEAIQAVARMHLGSCQWISGTICRCRIGMNRDMLQAASRRAASAAPV